MVIEFKKSSHTPKPTEIWGLEVELVESYTYLGTVLDNKLCFQINAEAIHRKVQSVQVLLARL